MPLLAMICRGTNLSTPEAEAVTTPLSLFCSLLSNALFSVHDKEFYEEEGKRLFLALSLEMFLELLHFPRRFSLF